MSYKNPELKQELFERMKELLPDEKDFQNYLKILKKRPVDSIRCNKIKISPEDLKKRLKEKKWKISQPWKTNPEVMIVEGKFDEEKNLIRLEPGELGRALEHLLGYYYIQELASMLPVIALAPKKNEIVLDLCASPGSKTTQIASCMNNTGTIIANEMSLPRLKILASNLERCGVSNVIITRKDGVAFCNRIKKFMPELKFSKILVDAPCSGEGTLRSSPKTYQMWNPNTIRTLSKIQKQLVSSAIQILEEGGEMIYSTCTHAPEENEELVDYVLENFPEMKIEKISLPIKPREGIPGWRGKTYSDKVKFACRVYPHDNNTEGFFLAKFRKEK